MIERWRIKPRNCAGSVRRILKLQIFSASLSIQSIDGKLNSLKFSEASKVGKEVPDDRIERSLNQRSVGYTYEAVKIFMPAGAKQPVYAPYREHVPPDTAAASLWLRNRRKDEWRDKQVYEHGGPDGGPITLEALLMARIKPPKKE
jgi:hypothetical protein